MHLQIMVSSSATPRRVLMLCRTSRWFAVTVTIIVASFLLSATRIPYVEGFAINSLFQETPTLQHNVPSKTKGVDIELPDFDELFGRIQHISPLAHLVITNHGETGNDNNGINKRGFEAIQDVKEPNDLNWKRVESNQNSPNAAIRQIDRIDNFQGHPAPLLRFRSTLQGPCIGECFARFIMDLDERKKWDTQIEQVYEAYPMYDLDAANIAMGFGRKYGTCTRLGVGYCQTKAGFGISPREQLTLCGVQEFEKDGSCIIWGVEMEEWHNHLLPPGPRHTRAKSHIFCSTLTPTADNKSFDVEYCLQLEVGGLLPTWLTTPVVTDSVKRMFHTAKVFYKDGKDSDLEKFLESKSKENDFANRPSLLMTP